MSSNANFVRGPDGKTVKKTVLPSPQPSVGNVTAVGKVQIDLNNIVVDGETISIEPESITFLNSTPGIAEANKAVVLDDNKNIEQLNVVNTSELYIGGNQVTGLVNKGATVSNSVYMNNIQPGIGRENKLLSSNDNGEVENADMSASVVEYNGGIIDSQSNEIYNIPSGAEGFLNSERYSHLKLKEIKNFYLLRTFNKVCYDTFRDINFATYIDTTTIDIFESVFKSGGGSFSKSITYASAAGLTFTKENMAYSPVLDKYLIPVTTATNYSITLSPAGSPSTWTNSSVWTTVSICTFTNQNVLMPYIKWSSLLNKFLTSAGGKVYQSNTGETWTELYTLSNATYTRTIICHSDYVMIVNPEDTAILYTTNGTTWLTKTFTSAFCVSTSNLVQYISEVDCIFAGANKIIASTFLARPATGNTFDTVYSNFAISYNKYPVRYIKDTASGRELLIHGNISTGFGNLYNVFSLETNSYIFQNINGHYFNGQIIVFSYLVTTPFTSTRALVYDISFESLYRGFGNFSKGTAAKSISVEPEVFLNFEVYTRAIIRDFQWVPDIKKYIAIGFANEAYATSEYANVCLYHSDDLVTFKFIRDLGRPNTNRIVVEETTGYVYCFDIGVNYLIILSNYGTTLVSSSTTIGAVNYALYDKSSCIGFIFTAGGPAVLACGNVITQASGYGTGYMFRNSFTITNSSNWISGFPHELLNSMTVNSGSGGISSSTSVSYDWRYRSATKTVLGTSYKFDSGTSYVTPLYLEQLNIFVRLRYNFNNDTSLKIAYANQTSTYANDSDPVWIDVPLQAPYFTSNSIWVPALRYDSNSGRLYVIGNSDLQRTVMSLNNLSLEEVPFMRNHLSAHYARDDSGNELYPLQSIYTPAINFNAIAYSCGVYVAVGLNTIFSGTKLSTATSSTLSGDWKGIASSLNHFIIAGSGKIAVSPASLPLNFQTNSTYPLAENWRYIHYSTQLNMWAACADGKWAFSTDTTVWTAVDVPGNWASIKHSNGYWVAVGLNNVGYLKMVTPAVPSTPVVTNFVGDWRDSDFGGRWIITGYGKTAFSSGLNKPDGWTTYALANGKNYNTAIWVDGLSHFFLAGENYSTFISSANKLYHAPAELLTDVTGKVCKFAMWSERYKGVIMVGNGCIMGTRMLGSGLDNSIISNSGIINTANQYNTSSFLQVADTANSIFGNDGYLSVNTATTNKDALSLRNNSTGDTVVLKQDNDLAINMSVPKAFAVEALTIKINDNRLSGDIDFSSLNIASEGVAASNNYLSLDSNGSVSGLTTVNCGGLIVGDEMYSESTPSQLTGVTAGTVTSGKAVRMDSNTSISGINQLQTNGVNMGAHEFIGEDVNNSLMKWSTGLISSMDGGNFNITDTCYSATLDLFVATTTFNGNTSMSAEREKNFILVSKDGVNWRKVYTGLNAGLMYVLPAEKLRNAVRTGLFFVATASGNFTNGYVVYTPDCVNFYWPDNTDYYGASSMNMGINAKMIFNDSVTSSPVIFKDPALSGLGIYYMAGDNSGNSASLKIGGVKNCISDNNGSTYYALAGNNAVSANSQIDMVPNSLSVGSGTINNCIFIRGLSGTGSNWDVVYVADGGRVLFKTASETTLALTTMQPNTTVVVDATCNFTAITYNPVSRKILITASNGKIYISNTGSKSVWTQVTVPNSSVFDMEWSRVRCAYEKGFLLIHSNDSDSKCNSKVCRVTNDGLFIETYTNIKRQLRLGAYGNGMYVVPIMNDSTLGYKIMYSKDGIAWKYSLMQSRGVYRVIYVASLNKFFACYDKYVISSTDAINWTIIFTHPVNGCVCLELDYAINKNTLLALFNGTSTQQLAYTTNLTDWNTSNIVSNDISSYQFMKYCEQLSRLIVCTYESNGNPAMYSDNFTTFNPCVSMDTEATNKPRGRNIMWVTEGSFLTMGNLWDGQWSSKDGINWTRNKVFMEYGSNAVYGFYTFNIMNNIYVEGYGDIIVNGNGSKGNNFVRISDGIYRVIAPAESNTDEWIYSMLMYNSDKKQIVAYKQSEGTRKGDTFLVLNLEDFRNNSREVPVDYIDKMYNDKLEVSSYLSTNNIMTLANSVLDGGSLNTVALNDSIGQLRNVTTALDSSNCNNIYWFKEIEQFYVISDLGILRSIDGENWYTALGSFNATALCYSPQLNMLVAVRNNNAAGCIATSTNGKDWTIRNSSNDTIAWSTVIWASGFSKFVACSNMTGTPASGNPSKIMTSVDGVNWVAVDTTQKYRGHVSMDYSPYYNIIVGITDYNLVSFYSIDGVNWVYPSISTSSYTPKTVTWVPSLKLFLCLHSQTSNGQIMSTSDGLKFTNFYYTTSDISCVFHNPDNGDYGSTFQQGTFYGFKGTTSNSLEYFGTSSDMGGSIKAVWSGKFKSYFFAHRGATNSIKRLIDMKAVYRNNPNPINGTVWKSVCWSPQLSIFVAVADSGNADIMISSNGNQWSSVDYYNPGMSFWGVCWSSELGIFVAVSKTGLRKVVTSTDGINWVERNTPGDPSTGGQWVSVCWSPTLSLFVATASAGDNRIMTSSNGINWTIPASALGNIAINSLAINSVCWSPDLSLFVAASNSYFIKSNDGVNWFISLLPSGVGSISSICWSPYLKMFAAVGISGSKVITSKDGELWTIRSSFIDTITPYSITWASSKFVVCGVGSSSYGFVAESEDGILWEQSYSTTAAYGFKSVAYAPSLNEYVIVADSGTDRIVNITNSDPVIPSAPYSSIDYKSSLVVTESTPPTTTVNWADVVYAPTYTCYIAVANTGTMSQKVCTSTDGVSWTNRTQSYDGVWSSICYNEFSSYKVVAANAGTGTYGFLLSSGASSFTVTGSGITNVSCICASEELRLFVALRSTGTNRVVTSAGSASNWVTSLSADENSTWSAVCWAPSLRLFVGLASSGTNKLMTSSNGTTWNLGTLTGGLENCAWSTICWSERLRMFLATSTSGDYKMMKSIDGVNWTPVVSTAFTSSLKKVIWCYGSGVFLSLLSTGNERLLYSYNGADWITSASISGNMEWTSIGWNPFTSTAIVTSAISPTNSKFMNVVIQPSPLYSIRSAQAVDDVSSLWQSIAFSSELSMYAAVGTAGSSRVMTSTDGVAWSTPATVPAEVNTTTWSSICWSGSIFVAVASAGTNRVMTSADGVTWSMVTSAVANAFTWQSVCWSQALSIFVAVANGGTGNRVMTSADGVTWTGYAASSNTNSWTNVCWSPALSRFVAVANAGTNRLMTSVNGTTWSSVTMPSTTDSNTWKCVCWADGLNQFTAVADSGAGNTRVITSKDGINWDLSLSTSYINFSYVTWAPSISLFVGVGISGTYRLMTSKDGGTWSYNTTSNNLNAWSSILWNPVAEKFVAVANSGTSGKVMNILVDRNNITMSYPTYTPPSTDFSVTYTSKTDTIPVTLATSTGYASAVESNNWYSVCWSPDLSLFVAVANVSSANKVMTSSNGINWTSRVSGNESVTWSSVCWSPQLSLFVAVGDTGTGNRVMTSPDGISWTSRVSANDSNNWQSVCWSPDLSLFVAVAYTGTNRVMTSSDGINWTSQTSAGEGNVWMSVCWSSQLSLFVAVAKSGSNRVMTSPDGVTWTARTSAVEGNEWRSICWSPELNIFVAIAQTGTNRVMTSPNGIEWTSRTSAVETNSWLSVCWCPEIYMFVAVGNTGSNRVMTSTDGIAWVAKASSAETNQWVSVCWSSKLKKVVAVSFSGTNSVMNINESPNLTVTSRPSVDSTTVWNAVCWSSELSLFVAGGNTGTNRVMTSPDGVTWTPRVSANPSSYINSICWSSELSLFVAVLATGTQRIMTSPNGIDWTLRNSAGSVEGTNWQGICWSPELSIFVVVAIQGSQRIMTSSNGIDWTPRNHPAGDIYWRKVCWSSQLSLFVAVAYSGTGNRVMTSSNGIDWVLRSSSNNTNQWLGVCWSPDLQMFASVSASGTSRVMTSSDGVNWTSRTSSTETNYWYDIIWSSIYKMFVAVSYDGANRVMRSFDGITWSVLTTSLDSSPLVTICESTQLNKIITLSGASGNSVGDISKTPYSTTYTTAISSVSRPTPPLTSTNIWQAICWSPELAIFVALSFQGTNRVMTSADGVNWTVRPSMSMDSVGWSFVCWSPKLKIFVATASSGTRRVGISSDGIRWETVLSGNESNNWREICWSKELGMFVSVSNNGTNRVMYSYNGINWVNVPSALESNGWNSVCWSPELKMFIAVSSSSTTSGAMYSRNGYNWVASGTLATANGWTSVTWSPALSLFVAVSSSGTNRFAYSSNGTSWTTIASPNETAVWYNVRWLPEIKAFIAVSSLGEVAESYNGTTWQITQKQTDSFTNTAWSPLLRKLIAVPSAISKNLLVLNTVNSPVVSPPASLTYYEPGTLMNKLSPGNDQPTNSRPIDVAYSNELDIYAAVCDQGTWRLVYSYNGVNWFFDTQSSATLNFSAWKNVCWNATWGMFIAIGSSGTDRIAVSTNGRTWTAISPTGFSKLWTCIVSRETNNTSGVAAMVIALSSTGDVLRSVNGVDWTVTASGNTSYWMSIVWNPQLSKFTAVSNSTTNRVMNSVDGVTWTTTTFGLANASSLTWSPQLSLYVTVSNTASTTPIYTSADGVTWTAVTIADTSIYTLTTLFQSLSVEWIPELNIFISICSNSNYSGLALVSKNGTKWFTKWIMPSYNSSGTLCKWNSFKQELMCVKSSSVDYAILHVKFGEVPSLSLPYRVKWDLVWSKGLQMFVAMKKINPLTNYTQFYLSTDGKSWSADTTNFTSHVAADVLRSITSYTEIPQWDMLITCKNSAYIQTISQNGVQQLGVTGNTNCVFYSSVLKCIIAGVYNSNTIGLLGINRFGSLTTTIYNTLPTAIIMREMSICNGNHIIIPAGIDVSSYYYSYDMAKFETGTLPFADEWHFASKKVRGYDTDVVAVSSNGIIIKSVDGISWTTVKNYNVLESVGSRKFTSIKYIEEMEVWIAMDEVKKINSCIYSMDGVNWVDVNMPSAVSLCDVSYSSSLDSFVFLTLPDDASQPVTTLATLPKLPTSNNVMKVDGFNISPNGGIYTGNSVSNTFLSNTLETMPLLALATNSAYKPSTSTWTINSDRRLKEEIENMNVDECLSMLERLELKYYKWKDEYAQTAEIEDRHKLGFIAQEVEEVVPEAVYEIGDVHGVQNAKSVNYDQLIAILYGAIQSLMARYERLKAELEADA